MVIYSLDLHFYEVNHILTSGNLPVPVSVRAYSCVMPSNDVEVYWHTLEHTYTSLKQVRSYRHWKLFLKNGGNHYDAKKYLHA